MAITTAGEHICDICGSFKPIFDAEHGYYRCSKCNHVWAFDEDDPDYQEAEDPSCPMCNGTGLTQSPYGFEDCGGCNGAGKRY